MKKLITMCAVLGVLLMTAGPAMADSISPTSFSATLDVGESVTVTKTVTVSEEPGSAAPVDVFFLADSTGSMYGAIDNVKSSMAAILAATSGLGDVQYAVGQYRDVNPPDIYSPAGPPSLSYTLSQSMTGNTANVTTAINSLFASGGGDGPEAQLYALHEAATRASTGWRAGSTRVLVWFGDIYGHNAPGDYGLADPLGDATVALAGANIAVLAIDLGSLNGYSQATTITTATGGAYYSGISSAAVGTTIASAITSAIETYNTVSLDLSEVPSGVTAVSVPGSYIGAFDRSEERTFAFDLTFTLDTAGTYDFNVYGLVDGGRVATEVDHIAAVPVPGALLLGMLGLSVAGVKLRKRA